ncbi:MAG: ribonucleoside hydrolase 1 [bacterium ADurb.Bin478]|nr:MAG: ribonucleoside hydrolase 1 [bacterium ADurb.Bin478]
MKFLGMMMLLMTALAHSAAPAGQRQKVIVDFDLGNDIDDAFALALLLASPELELVGITLDHGRTDLRAQIACRMLYEVGCETIPVAVGRQTAHRVGKDREPAPYHPQYYWAEGFTAVKPVSTPAADFIIHMLNRYPGEIVLITTGPVPNMADVVAKDAGALKKKSAKSASSADKSAPITSDR